MVIISPPILFADQVPQSQPTPRSATGSELVSLTSDILSNKRASLLPSPDPQEQSSRSPSAPPRARTTDPTTQASRDAVWPLKSITWPPSSESRVLIVMQARNGPCSLIALCNVLILRDEISIQPPTRTSVSYEYLAALIADYIVSQMTDGMAIDGLSAALQKLPDLQEGMDINSMWGSHSSFRQLGEGGELKLFGLCGVQLVHGWLADPSSSEYEGLIRVGDYDAAVNLIVTADDLTKGQLVEAQDSGQNIAADLSTVGNLTSDQKKLVSDAIAIRQFLESNSSQLTYFGLFNLTTTLEHGLYAFFRNSHLSVLYKSASADEPLYTLVTDSVFAREPAVVWETLEDIDGSASTFVDSSFLRASVAGGDFSGQTADDALTEMERAMQDVEIRDDQDLARRLQEEEDAAAQEARRRYEARKAAEKERPRRSAPSSSDHSSSRLPSDPQASGTSPNSLKSKRSKEKECLVM